MEGHKEEYKFKFVAIALYFYCITIILSFFSQTFILGVK